MIGSIGDSVDRYLDIYYKLVNRLKWHTQKEILMVIPLVYIFNNKEFDLEELINISKDINKKSSNFSPLESHQRFYIASMLISRYSDPKEKVNELIECQNKLIDEGFKNSSHLTMSALALISFNNINDNLDEKVDRAISIYKKIKSNYSMLNSAYSDYLISILFSHYEDSIEDLASDIDYYYSLLSQKQFKKGSSLHLLSYILMSAKIENKDFIINKCCELYKYIVDNNIKIKRIHYSQLGLMSIIDTDLTEDIQFINSALEILLKEKTFRWHKDMSLVVAISLVISKVINCVPYDATIIETGTKTPLENIIMAQNATLLGII
ncbi:hypothetical protein CLPU_12c00520 [Gottschalkia purinilytica]|uniref:DUF4003 domain-containing protein n=1 Tax=Gottschalkia purinilytica TaxID=1503 RepID=A0A0L0W8A2_GOTPU|nr:DUF4003 family protein [Gottschalkia purinilytica]KNF07779.1 hypothetical protein CLPU_12c00520 [Gottschalkia purinilytica]